MNSIRVRYRFTPTCVGKTVSGLLCLCWFVRFTPTCVGKTLFSNRIEVIIIGSPPRVWGKLYHHLDHQRGQSVHPHVCGENATTDLSTALGTRFTPTCVGKTPRARLVGRSVNGSPPRVWGKRREWRLRLPGCAVHPHVCGENSGDLLPF